MKWSTLVRDRARPWVFRELPPSAARPGLARRAARVDEDYLHVHLLAMRLPYGRRWAATYYPSLNSYVRLEHHGGEPAEFLRTTSPSTLRSITDGDTSRVHLGPTRLAGPVPYRGGGITLDIGLFAIKARDLAAPYLDFLQSVGEVAGISYLEPARQLIRPMQNALDAILGTEDTRLEAGAARAEDPARCGVFAVLATSALDGGVRLADDTLTWDDGTPVEDIAYVVFSVETSTSRADWTRLPGIAAAYRDLLAAARDDSYPDVTQRLARFRRLVTLSPDLLPHDADTIADTVEGTIHRALSGAGQSRTTAPKLPDFADLDLFPDAAAEPANRAV